MKIYKLESHHRPKWLSDQPTFRQLKVLKFFGIELTDQNQFKGVASGIIARLFSDPKNKELWEKYVYVTGDDSADSADLCPIDPKTLESVVIPDDWYPKSKYPDGRIVIPSDRKERMEKMVSEILEEGSPFDDPVPRINFKETAQVFTGKFNSKTRDECLQIVKDLGGTPLTKMSQTADYLVVGDKGSENWSHGTYGIKIQKAMMYRMETFGLTGKSKPVIVCESDWLNAVHSLLEFKNGYAIGYKMAVRECFKNSIISKSFEAGDTIYDTPKAYEGKWEESLKHINYGLQVKSSDGKTIEFSLLKPDENRTKLIQDSVHKEPVNEFIMKLRNGF